jgi:hypothetical protein
VCLSANSVYVNSSVPARDFLRHYAILCQSLKVSSPRSLRIMSHKDLWIGLCKPPRCSTKSLFPCSKSTMMRLNVLSCVAVRCERRRREPIARRCNHAELICGHFLGNMAVCSPMSLFCAMLFADCPVCEAFRDRYHTPWPQLHSIKATLFIRLLREAAKWALVRSMRSRGSLHLRAAGSMWVTTRSIKERRQGRGWKLWSRSTP